METPGTLRASRWKKDIYIYMGVSKNKGTPKWMVNQHGSPQKKWGSLFIKKTMFVFFISGGDFFKAFQPWALVCI